MNKHTLEQEVPVLALAFVGDSVFDTFIRAMLIKNGKYKPNLLHKRAQRYNKATAQSIAFLNIQPLLTEGELSIAMRGRNVKVNSVPKSATLAEYKNATGLEALVGYLHLSEQIERLDTIMKLIVEIIQREDEENESGIIRPYSK